MARAEALGGALLLKTLVGMKAGSKAFSVNVRLGWGFLTGRLGLKRKPHSFGTGCALCLRGVSRLRTFNGLWPKFSLGVSPFPLLGQLSFQLLDPVLSVCQLSRLVGLHLKVFLAFLAVDEETCMPESAQKHLRLV